MKHLLDKFNGWYDQLAEPWRFLFFLLVLMGWLPLLFLKVYTIGLAWMCVTICIAISRS